MFQSKAIKGPKPESSRPSKLYLWWIQTDISRYYYSFVYKFIENPIFQVKRLCQWYWNVFRFDYDFDGHCLFAIIEYKLKRILPVLEKGHAIQEDNDIKALKLAIKLAGRLKEDIYDMVNYVRHEKKWGELKSWFTPTNDGTGSSYWNSSRPNAVTPEQKEQERADHLANSKSAYARMKREEKWLYDILHKYLRNWWD